VKEFTMLSPFRYIQLPAELSTTLFLVFFFFLALFFHFIFIGTYLDGEFPFNTLGEAPQYWGNDLTRLMQISLEDFPLDHFRKYIPHEPVPYAPFSFLVFKFLAQFPAPIAIFLFILCFLVPTYFWLYNNLKTKKYICPSIISILILFSSYPVFYALDRLNIDAWILVILFIVIYKITKKNSIIGPVALALATSIKIYPALFSFLYISRRNYYSFFIFILSLTTIFYFSLFAINSSFDKYLTVWQNEILFSSTCFSSLEACQNLSLSYFFKNLSLFLGYLPSVQTAQSFQSVYGAICILLLALFLLVLYRTPKQHIDLHVTALTCLTILLPHMSYDYKGLLIFLPLGLTFSKQNTSYRKLIIFLFILFLVPKKAMGVHVNAILNNVIICSILITSIYILLKPNDTFITSKMVYRFITSISFCSLLFLYGAGISQQLFIPLFSAGQNFIHFKKEEIPGFFGRGWHYFEKDQFNAWRWMSSPQSLLNIRLDPRYQYKVNFSANNHLQNHNQEITFRLDGKFIQSEKIEPGQIKNITLHLKQSQIEDTLLDRHQLTLTVSSFFPPTESSFLPLGVSIAGMKYAGTLPNLIQLDK